jgi:hypothetical protein
MTAQSPVLSALQQKAVWEGWLSSEIRANYFADLAQQFAREQKICNWLILVISSGACLSAVKDLGHGLIVVLTLAGVALSTFSLVQQNQKRVTDALDLQFRWHRLANEFQSLWDDMYSEESRTKFAMLQEKIAELSKSSAALPNREKLMLKWQKHVEMHHLGKPVSA